MKKNLSENFSGEDYLEGLKSTLSNFPLAAVEELGSLLHSSAEKSMVYVIGNGGSALTAAHLATDLGVGSLRRSNPIRCISLADNQGVVTATSNDLEFKAIYSEQIRLFGKPNDILICISASGNSANLVKAVQTAKSMSMFTVAITGFDGGKLLKISDLNIHTPTKNGAYGIAEDLHSAVCHVLTEIVRSK